MPSPLYFLYFGKNRVLLSHYTAQTELEFEILLTQSLSWDYRHVPQAQMKHS